MQDGDHIRRLAGFRNVVGTTRGRKTSSLFLEHSKVRKRPTVLPLTERAIPPSSGPQKSIDEHGVCWIGGPSHVESAEQMVTMGAVLKKLGITYLRSRVFLPGEPNDLLSEKTFARLKLLRLTAERFSLKSVCEITSIHHIRSFHEHADILEVPMQHCSDFGLLTELGYAGATVIINRNPKMGAKEFLQALAYLEKGGRTEIIVADNGSLARDGGDRRIMDVSTLLKIREETKYPVLVNCRSTAEDLLSFERIASAAIMVGASGFLVELDGLAQFAPHETNILDVDSTLLLMRKASAIRATADALRHFELESCERKAKAG